MLSGGVRGRRKTALLIAMIMIAGMFLISCGSDNGRDTFVPSDEVTHVVSGLSLSTTYYWKIVVDDGNGGVTESEVRNFTTQ